MASTVRLGDVATFVRGITFKPGDVVPPDSPGSVWCLRTKNVQADLDLSDLWAVPEAFVKTPDRYLRSGDVLVSSANSWNLVGKCSWVPALPSKSTFGGFVSALRAVDPNVDPRFLFHWFSSPRIQAILRSFGQQTTNISNLNIERCLELRFPLLSRRAQARVADLLDRASALRARRRAALAQLDALGSAGFLERFGDPASNPKGWATASLEQLFELVRGGSPRPIDDYWTDDPKGVNWILISDASKGSKYITRTKKRIRKEGATRSRSVKPGDFLLTNSMSFGRPYIMGTYGCVHDGWLVLSPRDERIHPDYLYELLSSSAIYAEFRRLAPGATVKNLNIDIVKMLRIPVPPMEAQREFSNLIASVERLREHCLLSEAQLDTLFASLQHRAFNGTLWPDREGTAPS